ncbi:MAG: histidine phosphatase family protein [Clostridiales bacterium]|nr:histidine phosphatase family protein [Clostridiales bacterium]
MEILIVRHGETVWNKDGKIQGTANIQLNEHGRDLARKTGEALKDIQIDRIYSSPLDRAYETASLIMGDRNLEIIKDDRIREICFGEYEGQKIEELEKETSFTHFFKHPELFIPGKDGETLEALCKRGADFMENEILPLNNTCKRVMIVAHGAMNKALMMYVKNQDISKFWSGGLQQNCNVIILDYKDEEFQIIDEQKIFY